MIQAAGQVVSLKLNIDHKDVAPIAEKYKVSAIPAVFVMDADGKVLGVIDTTPSPARFAADVERVINAHKSGGRNKHTANSSSHK